MNASVAHSFIQMLGMFSEQRKNFTVWVGRRGYAASKNKKRSLFRKGAIMDRKIE
jgi:hypothetical protein